MIVRLPNGRGEIVVVAETHCGDHLYMIAISATSDEEREKALNSMARS